MQYRLRTLLIVLAIGPALLAGAYWQVERYQQYQRQRALIDLAASLNSWQQHRNDVWPPGARPRYPRQAP